MTALTPILAFLICAVPTVELQHDAEPLKLRSNANRQLTKLIVDLGIRYDDIPTTRELRQTALVDGVDGDPGFVGRSELAFRYQFVSLFTLNVWAWNGRHVMHDGRAWLPLSAEGERRLSNAGMRLPQRPLSYTVPPGALLVAGGAVAWLWWRWRGGRTHRP